MLERAIAKLDRQERVTIGAELARRLVDVIVEATSTDALTAERPIDPAKVLHSLIARLPDGSREALPAPLAVKVTVDGRALTKSDAFEYK